eukprot:TRINITY_DN439_c1_g1_i1.p1 TRINITY_DN439_c1_g1~~TRINITY_DN439_c1_g1_i1.p1  ORF type:complete len:610 (-),score=176.21 TRINITY_DN439_c1_g1_i1:20-1849(-)
MNKQGSFTVGDYHSKGQRIGKGSFASVYLGYKVSPTSPAPNNNEVAIKVVDVELLSKQSSKLRKHLESEIQIMKSLKHPNIVEMKEVYFEDDEIYMVLEYCRQGDLYSYLKQHKILPESQAQSLFFQLSEGLKLLRSRNIIHRDLKPQNLLLTPSSTHPSIPTLKIADFGFARFMDPESVAATLCGSPLYMAPEILFGLPYDSKSDLWSSGCILLEMLTGTPLFPVRTHLELIRCFESWKGELNIKNRFGGQTKISTEAENLIGALLKQNTEDRMSWREFFDHSWIKKGENLLLPTDQNSSKSTTIARSDTITIQPNKNNKTNGSGSNNNSVNSGNSGSLKERLEIISPTANSNGRLSESLRIAGDKENEELNNNNNSNNGSGNNSGIDSFELLGSSEDNDKKQKEREKSGENFESEIETKLKTWHSQIQDANLLSELGNYNAEIKNNGAEAVVLYIQTLTLLQSIIQSITSQLSIDPTTKPETVAKNETSRKGYIEALKMLGEVKESYGKNLRKLEHWRIYVNTAERLRSVEEIMYLTAMELGKEGVMGERGGGGGKRVRECYGRGVEVLKMLQRRVEKGEGDWEVLEEYVGAFEARLMAVGGGDGER